MTQNNSATRTQAHYLVRAAKAPDAAALLQSMKRLAEFEHYIDDFRVTEADLLDGGLDCVVAPKFSAFVAEGRSAELVGHAVVIEIAFTYDMRPTLVH